MSFETILIHRDYPIKNGYMQIPPNDPLLNSLIKASERANPTAPVTLPVANSEIVRLSLGSGACTGSKYGQQQILRLSGINPNKWYNNLYVQGFDTSKIGDYLLLQNNNLSVVAQEGITATNGTTVLAKHIIKTNQKVMFSMTLDVMAPYSGYNGVGIANDIFDRSAEETGYMGGDTNSLGLYDDGRFFYNENGTQLSLTMKSGDVIDIAVDRVNNLIWFRVNNGYWNGEPTNKPEAKIGGIDISAITGNIYPGATPYWDSGVAGIITINTSANVPRGFEFIC